MPTQILTIGNMVAQFHRVITQLKSSTLRLPINSVCTFMLKRKEPVPVTISIFVNAPLVC